MALISNKISRISLFLGLKFFIGFVLLWLLLLVIVSPINANEKSPTDLHVAYEILEKDYQQNIKNIPAFQQTQENIDNKIKDVAVLIARFEDCISQKTTQLESLKANIKLLGEETESEDVEIKKQRKELDKRLQDVDNEVKRCNLLKIQLDKISDELGQFRLDLLKQQLLRKEDSVFDAYNSLTAYSQSYGNIIKDLKNLLSWKVLLAGFMAFLLGFFFRNKLSHHEFDSTKHSSPSLALLLKGLWQTTPILFFLMAIWLGIAVSNSVSNPVLLKAIIFAFIQVLAFAFLRNLIFQGATEGALSRFPRSRVMFLLSIAILFSSIAFLLNEELFGRYFNSSMLYYAWVTAIVISAISYILIIHYSTKILLSKSTSSVYLYLPAAVIVVIIFLALLGYRNLASLLFFGLILSLITLFLMFFMVRISSEFFDSLDQGKIIWQKNLRKILSVEDERAFPGVIWLRMLSFF